MPLGFLLEGRLMEKRHETEKAIAAYEHALDLKAGPAASRPLVALLVRERRTVEFDRVRAKLASITPEIERLATIEAIRSGDTSRALQLTAGWFKATPRHSTPASGRRKSSVPWASLRRLKLRCGA